MTDYSNWKILKSDLDEKAQEYAVVADWCNKGQKYTIVSDEEYYKVQKVPEPTEQEIYRRRIAELKNFLLITDYVVIKIAEGSATAEQYADLIEQRRSCRKEINQLEHEI